MFVYLNILHRLPGGGSGLNFKFFTSQWGRKGNLYQGSSGTPFLAGHACSNVHTHDHTHMHPLKEAGTHTSTLGPALCSKYLEEEEVERDGRPLQTISQCRHSGGRRRGEQERKREMKTEGKKMMGRLQKEGGVWRESEKE